MGAPSHRTSSLPVTWPARCFGNPTTSISSLLHHQVEFAFRSNAAHGRQVVSAQGNTDNRGLAHGSVGAHLARQQVEPRLVGKDQRPSFCYRLFLIWGQRSSCHRWMIASFLWLARGIGFWLLHIPKRSRIRVATLG